MSSRRTISSGISPPLPKTKTSKKKAVSRKSRKIHNHTDQIVSLLRSALARAIDVEVSQTNEPGLDVTDFDAAGRRQFLPSCHGSLTIAVKW